MINLWVHMLRYQPPHSCYNAKNLVHRQGLLISRAVRSLSSTYQTTWTARENRAQGIPPEGLILAIEIAECAPRRRAFVTYGSPMQQVYSSSSVKALSGRLPRYFKHAHALALYVVKKHAFLVNVRQKVSSISCRSDVPFVSPTLLSMC